SMYLIDYPNLGHEGDNWVMVRHLPADYIRSNPTCPAGGIEYCGSIYYSYIANSDHTKFCVVCPGDGSGCGNSGGYTHFGEDEDYSCPCILFYSGNQHGSFWDLAE
ncbi:MAG: hypothetical protein ACLFQV_05635, partial [Vulcanimicrobiota bacterium]